MRLTRALARPYALLLALLAVHEVDSAYWREWEIFHLPGGIQFFAALHVPLLYFAALGLLRVARGDETDTQQGAWAALGLALAGIACPVIHGAFLWGGHSAFRTPVSIVLMAACGLAALPLGYGALRRMKHPSGT